MLRRSDVVVTVSETFRERLVDVKQESGFLRWLFGSAARGDREAVIARSDELTAEAQDVLADTGAEARALREDLARRLREPTPDRATLGRTYRERHAEVCSVLDGALAPKDVKIVPLDPEAGTRMPEQIV